MNMRSLIDLLKESLVRKPYIHAHRSGPNTIEIEMMEIPHEMRGKGEGRKFYGQWEASLPPDIKYVRLWAADTGSGKTNGFWEQLGFEYVWAPAPDSNYDETDDQWWWMIKGVNGTPTPASKIVDDEDEDY